MLACVSTLFKNQMHEMRLNVRDSEVFFFVFEEVIFHETSPYSSKKVC